MEIEYQVSEKDLEAFADYQVKYSPRVKATLWRIRIGYIIGPFLLAFGMWMLGRLITVAATIALVGILLFFLGPTIYRQRLKQHYLRAYHDPANRMMYGRRKLTIQEDGLEISSEGSQSFVQWSGIVKVDQTPTQGYLYLSSNSVVMIPRGAVGSEQFDTLMLLVKERLSSAAPAPGITRGDSG